MSIQLSQHHLLKMFSVFSLLSIFGSLVKYYLTIYAWFYFWTLDSVPLSYMSSLMIIPHCLRYCSFVVSFKIVKFESSDFVLFQDPLPLVTGHSSLLRTHLKTHLKKHNTFIILLLDQDINYVYYRVSYTCLISLFPFHLMRLHFFSSRIP